MSEILYEFEEGPYDILDFKVRTDNDKIMIEIDNGDLGRLPIENVETVEKLREALDKIEAHLKEQKRRGEEL